ncbi:tetratricopeptide repeat protein [Catalinimonas niigatensis]|uniref:tetratricopeptide repeat protein n=1 Tax=Catalinimonas niigatensis TaxID=1397264 RepID=UPI002666CA77|nr:tetratricopeptide repeat protein [Catalinimonas niigatensis]WPP50413.1 tetratricopeptide repeat protein [Catalinimonas niigatensis]
MKRIVLLFFAFLLHISLSLATPRIDSLMSMLNIHTNPGTERADLLADISSAYWIKSPDSSEVYGLKALELATQLDYHLGMANANRTLGVCHWARGNHDDGLKYLLDALTLYRALDDSLGIANATMNIALVYRDQGDYDNAFPRFFISYDMFKNLDRKDRLVNTANHLGLAYFRTDKLAEAQRYFNEALALSKEINYQYGLATALHHLGNISQKQKNHQAALDFYEKSLKIQQSINDWEGATHTMHSIGSIYAEKQEYTLAIEKLKTAEQWAHKVSSKMMLSEIYLELKEVYAAQNKFHQALSYYEAYTKTQDSVLNAQKTRELLRMEHQHELEKKEQHLTIQEQKIALLRQESKIKLLWVYLLGIGILLTAGLASMFSYLQRLKNQKNRELMEKQQRLTQIELENTRLKEQELAKELEHKHKELTSYSLNFIQKNELVDDIKESLRLLKKNSDQQTGKKLEQIQRMLNTNFQIDRDWEDFRLHFEKVHQRFFIQLKERCPDLSPSELKLCTLIKLNMNLKEAARILGISPESVKTARYRLRKKLDLPKQQNLNEFLQQLDQSLQPDRPVSIAVRYQHGTFSKN